MKFNIKPYTKIYMNCYLNNFVSLLHSINPTYEDLVFENAYTYKLFVSDITGNSFVKLSYNYAVYQKAYLALFGTKLPYETLKQFMSSDIPLGQRYYQGDFDVIQTLKKTRYKKAFFVQQDSNYALGKNENSTSTHKSHFSLIIDYDEIKDIFIMIDNGTKGYRDYFIEPERVKKAFENTNKKLYICTLPRVLSDYTIEIETLFYNAEKIIESIDYVLNEKFCNIYFEKDDFDICINNLTIISNRHIANLYLFQAISRLYRINNKFICAKCNELIREWSKIKLIMIHSFLKYDRIETTLLFKTAKELLQTETTIWKEFIKVRI